MLRDGADGKWWSTPPLARRSAIYSSPFFYGTMSCRVIVAASKLPRHQWPFSLHITYVSVLDFKVYLGFTLPRSTPYPCGRKVPLLGLLRIGLSTSWYVHLGTIPFCLASDWGHLCCFSSRKSSYTSQNLRVAEENCHFWAAKDFFLLSESVSSLWFSMLNNLYRILHSEAQPLYLTVGLDYIPLIRSRKIFAQVINLLWQ